MLVEGDELAEVHGRHATEAEVGLGLAGELDFEILGNRELRSTVRDVARSDLDVAFLGLELGLGLAEWPERLGRVALFGDGPIQLGRLDGLRGRGRRRSGSLVGDGPLGLLGALGGHRGLGRDLVLVP